MMCKIERFVALSGRLISKRYIDTPLGRESVKKWSVTVLDTGKGSACLCLGAVLDSDIIPFYVVLKSYSTTKECAYRLLVEA